MKKKNLKADPVASGSDYGIYQSFGEHLEDLRRMLIRILVVVAILAVVIFCFKKETFDLLLAPASPDFCTFSFIRRCCGALGYDFTPSSFNATFINTELSAQFMMHIYVACILALLLSSPYILYELFRFVSPALYEKEKKYSRLSAVVIGVLFAIGVAVSYFILFPVSFRFLSSYQVHDAVANTITISSYISTFATLTFMLGIVFQLPVVMFFLGKMGLIQYETLRKYRSVAFVAILIISAVITPPDVFTLVLTAIPLYALFELSLLVVRKTAS